MKQEATDERSCESELVTLLEHDKFDLIKLIRNNRHVILYSTLLAKAQTPAEKAAIEAKMSNDDELVPILAAIREVRFLLSLKTSELIILFRARRLTLVRKIGPARLLFARKSSTRIWMQRMLMMPRQALVDPRSCSTSSSSLLRKAVI